jgi:excinuclease ABC subunit A
LEHWNDKSVSRGSIATPSFHHSITPTLRVINATRHNLKNLSVAIPLQRFVCVTGVSGSGKSTLLRDILLPALQSRLQTASSNPQSAMPKASDRLDADETSSSPDAEDSALRTPHSASISGCETLGQVVLVDQSLLGKTPRSNPAVYIGAFDDIRELFAQSEAARRRGFNASAFSFNSAQGQCGRCRGAGFEKIEMQFLSDVFIRCPKCGGRRYRPHILEVKIGGRHALVAISAKKQQRQNEPDAARTSHGGEASPPPHAWSIADLLEATVDETIEFLSGFADSRPSHRAVASLKLLQEVGLGYLRLGQPINTLSGGESQRLKLVRHLAETVAAGIPACRRAEASSPAGKTSDTTESHEPSEPSASPNAHPGGRMPPSTAARMAAATLFLFDEPTTGLHFDDVRVLLQVFQRLVDAGHSVIVIEHNLDVIKCADWVIDLGPEAGDGGGQIVAEGTPEQIANCSASHTGRALKTVLNQPTRDKT